MKIKFDKYDKVILNGNNIEGKLSSRLFNKGTEGIITFISDNQMFIQVKFIDKTEDVFFAKDFILISES